MSRRLPTVLAGGLVIMLVVVALMAPPIIAYSPYTFTASYEINDITGALSYTESGSFAEYPTCSLPWQDQPPVIQPIPDARHMEVYRFDKVLARWVHETRQNFVSTFVESVCTGIVTLSGPTPECDFYSPWIPVTPITQPLPLTPGWHDLVASQVGDTAVPTSGQVNRALDLTYLHMQPTHNATETPYTGRFSFEDRSIGGPGRSGSMIAGRCVGPASGGNGWAPGMHEFRFGPISGLVDQALFVPGYGPLGQWQMSVKVCNSNC